MASKHRAAQRRTMRADKSGGVMLAVPTGGSPEPQFLRSVALFMGWDAAHAGHVIRNGCYLQREATDIANQRNQIVRTFLERDEEWLWFVDDDMEFQENPDILDQLLASADPQERPIVGALCFARLRGDNHEIVATIYGLTIEDGNPKLLRFPGYERDKLVPVSATGTGCLLIHRRVLVELAKRWECPSPWFEFTPWGHGEGWGKIPGTDIDYAGPPDKMGEDITFCMRVGSTVGDRKDYDGTGETFPIYVDTRIKCGHVKKFVIDEYEYALRHPVFQQPAPNIVIIPVRGQHKYTENLLHQLADQGEADRIYVYDNGADTDPYTGFVPNNCEIIPAAGLNIHEMWNAGIRRTQRDYSTTNIAILNNDLELGPRFLSGLANGLRNTRGGEALFAVCPNYDGRTFESDVQQIHGIAAGREDGSGGLSGFAFMVKGEIFDHGFPLFDEQFELWFGDTDFVANVQAAGGQLGMVRDTTVVHIDGGSKTAGDGTKRLATPELEAMAARDQERFVAKWAQ